MDSVNEMASMAGINVGEQKNSIIIDKSYNGISSINFDPNAVSAGVINEATFIVLDADFKSKNKTWAEFTCQGIKGTRFKLKYWFNEKPEIQSLIGKITVCDIVKDQYGFSTRTLPEVIDGITNSSDFDNAKQMIMSVINNDAALVECLNKPIQGEKNYMALFMTEENYHSVINLAVKLQVAKDTMRWYSSVNTRAIYGGLIFRSMNVLFKSTEVKPDFLVYQNIYSRIWDKEKFGSIAKYFVEEYIGADINTYVLDIIETTTSKIMSGGMIC